MTRSNTCSSFGTLTPWATLRDSWRGSKSVSVAIRNATHAGRLLEARKAQDNKNKVSERRSVYTGILDAGIFR